MKYLQYILLCFLLFVSCSKETDTGHDVPEGMVEVRINMPTFYNGTADTKAESTTLAPYDHLVMNIPVGSTIWLSYAKKLGEGSYETPVIKPYVVRSSRSFTGLYPCGIEEYTDKDGVEWMRAVPDQEASPLYLEPGATYKFKSIYPALDVRKSDLNVNLRNGIWACTNDPRYTQTASQDVTLGTSTNRVTYIDLKPMINQTARLHFEIGKGENVHSIEMMHTGIEIAGVQDKGTLFPLDWTQEDYIKVLQMEPIDDGEHWFKLQKFEVQGDKIIGDAYILPLDVRRTYIFILINMAVNGIPTQYVATLNGIILENAHSYNFDMKAGVNGNLTVVNWQNTSLTIVQNK